MNITEERLIEILSDSHSDAYNKHLKPRFEKIIEQLKRIGGRLKKIKRAIAKAEKARK